MTAHDSFSIVVGVDGSKQSLAALDWAVTEARLRNGQVRVITAWYYPPLASTVADGFIDDTFRQNAERVQAGVLAALAAEGVGAEGIAVTGQVVENSPGAALLEAGADADLLIVGSHGHGGVAGIRLGSVAAHVIHHARCSVLIVRPRAS